MTGNAKNASQYVTGPHAWINWQAQRMGQPRRENSHPDAVVVQPLWEEFALYTDAPIEGPWLILGPYEVSMLDHPWRARIGLARKALLLRMWDHLSDEPTGQGALVRDDVANYHGGDLGDELAALLGLALGRRMRSGGSVRIGMPGHPVGLPSEWNHHPPVLEPPRDVPMIASVADAARLPDAQKLLESYPLLDTNDAVALVRAARQYVDALWVADGDPRLCWIKLISALEVAANRHDAVRQGSALAQLKRHRRRLWRKLEGLPAQVQEEIAAELAGTFNVQQKLLSFVKAFDPGPPPVRPAAGLRVQWDKIQDAVATIYEHRSRDLHDGIAFPWVLCEPPRPLDDNGIPPEAFWALGVSGRGGQWSAESLPIFLHTFAHLAGGALRNWWSQLGRTAAA